MWGCQTKRGESIDSYRLPSTQQPLAGTQVPPPVAVISEGKNKNKENGGENEREQSDGREMIMTCRRGCSV